MLVFPDTLVLTIKGYRPLFSLPQGVPIISYVDGEFKVIPLSYEVKKKKPKPSNWFRVKYSKREEQLWNGVWAESGGYTQWFSVHKKTKFRTVDGDLIDLTLNEPLLFCDSSLFNVKETPSKVNWSDINEQLIKNSQRTCKPLSYKFQIKEVKDLVQEHPYLKPNEGKSIYKTRPCVNKNVITIIADSSFAYSYLVKLNHGIISNGLFME